MFKIFCFFDIKFLQFVLKVIILFSTDRKREIEGKNSSLNTFNHRVLVLSKIVQRLLITDHRHRSRALSDFTFLLFTTWPIRPISFGTNRANLTTRFQEQVVARP